MSVAEMLRFSGRLTRGFVLSLQVTAKTAFLFILPQYNVSVPTAGKRAYAYISSKPRF